MLFDERRITCIVKGKKKTLSSVTYCELILLLCLTAHMCWVVSRGLGCRYQHKYIKDSWLYRLCGQLENFYISLKVQLGSISPRNRHDCYTKHLLRRTCGQWQSRVPILFLFPLEMCQKKVSLTFDLILSQMKAAGLLHVNSLRKNGTKCVRWQWSDLKLGTLKPKS